jgi:asparagine synthase (glutamine-hydrolysing)
MCGITGFTQFNKNQPDPEQLLGHMAKALTHRGPDGHGQFINSEVALGHRRLSIIDLAGGAQPMTSACGRFTIIYNGEVYNYIELRSELQSQGHTFRTESDTEVILELFAKNGNQAVKQLNGMFAIALWDHHTSSLTLIRDRFGIKPLYYADMNGDIAFASEMKSIKCFPGISGSLDMLSVSKFLTYSFIPSPATIYEGVHKLEPGRIMTINRSGTTMETYWDIPLDDQASISLTEDECREHIIELLEDSIKKRFRSDVPVGIFLSGGLDSGMITALASKAFPGKIKTFSVGFEESSYDESPYAKLVAEHCKTEHHHEILSMKQAVDLLPDVMGLLDEPFGDPSFLPTWLLSKFTSSEVKVALGGDGGDELFAGYASFPAHQIMEKISLLPATWRNQLVKLSRKIPVSGNYASLDFLTRQFFKGAGISPEVRFSIWMGAFGNQDKKNILSDDVNNQLLRENPFEDISRHIRNSQLDNDLQRLLYLCMKLYMQDDILTKVDRASMLHSLEVRVPFLDHQLVEFVSGIDSVLKLKGLQTKYILKQAAAQYLPHEIIKRRKAGFAIPVSQWLRQDLKPQLESLCTKEVIESQGLFNYQAVRKMIDDHHACKHDYRKELWTLFSFLFWKEHND